MKWQDCSSITLVLAVFVAVHVSSSEEAIADYAFGKPVNLGPVVNSQYPDAWWGGSISADGLSLYFDSQRPGGFGQDDLWVATRASVSDPWEPPVNLGASVNTAGVDACPSISADGLQLYFSSTPPSGVGGQHGGDLWVTTRATVSDTWGPRVWLGPIVNTQQDEVTPCISTDGLSLFFGSGRPSTTGGTWSIWMSMRPTQQSAWGPPVNLELVPGSDFNPCLSSDGQLLFFTCGEPNPTSPLTDIWVTTRASTSDSWGDPMALGPNINSPVAEWPTGISADGSTLYFASNRPGGYGTYDLWQVPISPIVDINGDGIVDLKDFSILAQSWGRGESSVDIGPMPWGDGTVDIQDIAVLADHWLKEILPLELAAYWKLDETEGTIAKDGVGEHDATLNGNPVWQPAGGRLNGALELDGIDDYVSTLFIVDPGAGAFSVFAWIKGTTAGQVVISQTGGENWLSTSAGEGKLMTELKAAGRYGTLLFSEAVIIDADWHQVALTWDGSTRTLYVDGAEVAKGTQGTLAGSTGALYIGAGKNLEAGSFWFGLIDDVRIHSRAVSP